MKEHFLADDFFDEIPIEKIGFFKRLANGMKKLFSRKSKAEAGREQDAYSRFKHFYEEIDITNPAYVGVRQAATLCDDALRIATKRIRVSKHLSFLNDKLSELEAFINLTEEEITNLKKMLERFVSLAKERSVLLEKLTDYDASLVDMEPLAEDAWQVIPSIKEAEKHQRALKMDIGYLAFEKEELVAEQAAVHRSIEFMHKVAIGGVGVFFAVGVLLGLLMFLGTEILVPTIVFMFLVVGFFVIVTMFRYRAQSEVKINKKKQQKAVEMLNKKSVVYAYYTNFLKFCYNKYKARNSRTLENNLKDLEGYRQLANRIDTVRSLMYETETGIERFLREKKLGLVKSTMEGFAKTINIDDKQKHYRDYSNEKAIAEKTLAELDRRHEEIWHLLMELNANDAGTTVNKVIEKYVDLAEETFKAQDDPETEEYEPRPIWKLFDLFDG